MPTIMEMHAKAGHPNLDTWRLVENLKLAEVAMLCAGIDPIDYNWWDMPSPKQHPCAKDAIIILRALTESVKNGSLPVNSAYANIDGETHHINDDEISEFSDIAPNTTISRRAMMNWLEKKGLTKNIKPTSARIVKNIPAQSPQERLAPPKYSTPALSLLEMHVDKHWINYDPTEPDTAPDKDQTQTWLRDKAKADGLSQNIADAIDLVTRHPNAKAGNRVKRVTTRKGNDDF